MPDALNALIAALGRTKQRLSAPCLKVALVGTTSSGKSTLLNALIGHKLLPTETKEMSAGVVRIRNGSNTAMSVNATEWATWQTGDYNVHSDDDIYKALRDKNSGIFDLCRGYAPNPGNTARQKPRTARMLFVRRM